MLKKQLYLSTSVLLFAAEGKSNLLGGTKPNPTPDPDVPNKTTNNDPDKESNEVDQTKTDPGNTVDNPTPPDSEIRAARAEQTPPVNASQSTTQSTVTASVPVPTQAVQSDQALAAQSAAEEAAVELAKRTAEADAATRYSIQPWDAEESGDGNTNYVEEEFERPVREVPQQEIYQAYKHKRIARFSVADFHFVDHILIVNSEEDNERFLDLYDGLEAIDRNAIVKFNLEAAMSAEQPMNQKSTRTAAGMASTRDFKDPKSIR